MQADEKKIILVNPPLSLSERYGGLKDAGNLLPNLGLCYLAGVARKQGWQVKIIDCPVLGFPLSSIVQEIQKANPSIVGVTATTPAMAHAHSLMKAVRQSLPGALSLVGGPHVSALATETLRGFDSFDIGVVGEGELTLKEILEYKEGKKDIAQIKGIVYRDKGRILSTPAREPIENIDELPFPAWDLLPPLNKFYRPSLQCVRRLPSTILVASRGCPYQCSFCDHSVFGYRIRHHSSSYLIDMIHHLQSKYRIRDFAFHDECLLSSRERAVDLAESILKEDLDISWTVQARVDQVDAGILDLFKKAGCWQVQLGIESGIDSILKNLNKGVSQEQIIEACRRIKETGLSLKGFFMLGNPGETEETIEATFKFALRLPLDDFQCTFFTPYPGSQIYRQLDKWGSMATEDFSAMSQYRPVFLPHSLDGSLLYRQFRKGYQRFYLRPRIIKNYLFRAQEPSLWASYIKAFFGFLRFSDYNFNLI